MFTGNGGYSYINRTGQIYSAPFSNTIAPTGPHTLTFAQRGGQNAMRSRSKTVNKRKIKNISNMYKMPARKLRHYKKSLKRKLNGSKRRRSRRSSRRYKHMKGGSTVSYAVGGVLSPEMSGMANGLLSVNSGNNSSDYNHYARV